MTQYVQYRFANTIHIIRETWASGVHATQCGRWYHPAQSHTLVLHGEREEDVVCAECRRLAAAAAGKRVYSRPTLRRGLSEAKRAKLRKAQQAHTDRQRLAAWNAAAQQERTP
jgi:hypothetical protein